MWRALLYVLNLRRFEAEDRGDSIGCENKKKVFKDII